MLSFLMSPYGRVSRASYWLSWLLPYIGVSIVVVVVDNLLWPPDPLTHRAPAIFRSILSLLAFWPSIALSTKRLHDRGMTGWWNLASLGILFVVAGAAYWYYRTKMTGGDPAFVALPVATQVIVAVCAFALVAVSLYVTINVLFLRGQNGDNKYGADPLGEGQAEVFS